MVDLSKFTYIYIYRERERERERDLSYAYVTLSNVTLFNLLIRCEF